MIKWQMHNYLKYTFSLITFIILPDGQRLTFDYRMRIIVEFGSYLLYNKKIERMRIMAVRTCLLSITNSIYLLSNKYVSKRQINEVFYELRRSGIY